MSKITLFVTLIVAIVVADVHFTATTTATSTTTPLLVYHDTFRPSDMCQQKALVNVSKRYKYKVYLS